MCRYLIFLIFSYFMLTLYAQSDVNTPISGVGEPNYQNYHHRNYVSPTPNDIPIIASTVFNSTIGPRQGDLNAVKDCGFNVCMDYASPEIFTQLLECMDGTGLRLLMQGESFMYHNNSVSRNWKQTLPEFVDRFKDNPIVAGWNFCDEPKWNLLDEVRQRYDLLDNVDPGHLIYINLVGQMAKDFTGPCKTLPQYLDSIQVKLPMSVWSFDFYPIIIRNKKLNVEYDRFYGALDAFSQKSKETGKPMWSYLESMEYSTKSNSRPAATLPYLSFAAFSSLAYGAQGLLYWTYWQRPSNDVETYKGALVNLEGEKLPAWYAAKKVNHQIKALTPVFLGAEMIECRHTGEIGMEGTYPYIRDFGPLEELSNDVKGVLVSHLQNDGRNYLVIVNHDVENKQKVRMKFRNQLPVKRLIASDDGVLSTQSVNANYNVTLTQGGYAVFEY